LPTAHEFARRVSLVSLHPKTTFAHRSWQRLSPRPSTSWPSERTARAKTEDRRRPCSADRPDNHVPARRARRAQGDPHDPATL